MQGKTMVLALGAVAFRGAPASERVRGPGDESPPVRIETSCGN
jgi:hypothetical protein